MKELTLTILFIGAASAGFGAVLAPGDPPLTEEMVEHRVAVLDTFLDVHLNAEQQQILRTSMVDAWKNNDRKVMQFVLEDLKFYGNLSGLQLVRKTNLESYVEDLRNHPDKPADAMLLAAVLAAHPEFRDVMHARGWGDLVGNWETGDAMAAPRNPVTGQVQGISFSEALILKIFSDGHFHHDWVHRFCAHGQLCCSETGTSADGTVAVEGSKLTLETGGVMQFRKDPCVAANNITNNTGAQQPTFEWTLKRGQGGKPMLCLTHRPFQVTAKADAVCYTKQS